MSRLRKESIRIICSDCSKPYIYQRSDRKGCNRIICGGCRVQRRRKKIKLLAVEYKGGKCLICGYSRCIGALEFHHLYPDIKKFGIAAKGWTRGWDSVKSELDKCILVCANCHREIEAGIVDLKVYGVTVA